MSTSDHQKPVQPAPPIPEIEHLLQNIRPRPTARLSHLLRQAPWYTEAKEPNMIRTKRIELVSSISIAVFLIVVAGVIIYGQWFRAASTTTDLESTTEQITGSSPAAAQLSPSATPAGDAAAAAIADAATPTPTPTMISPATISDRLWQLENLAGYSPAALSIGGMAYGPPDETGRLYIAAGLAGILIVDDGGNLLLTVPIADPETGQPVFVHDVIWSPLLWLAPPEAALIALTDPFASGDYLQIIDPADGALLQSLALNDNIAVPTGGAEVSERLPHHLAAGPAGELYTYRIFDLVTDATAQPHEILPYLLRSTIDGRILNPVLVEPAGQAPPETHGIAALAYQAGTDTLFAAIHDGEAGTVKAFNLIGTPEEIPVAWAAEMHWETTVALSAAANGHVFFLLDAPAPYIVELDEQYQLFNVHGFLARDQSYVSGAYAEVVRAFWGPVTNWLPDLAGEPVAMTVAPDGARLYLVFQDGDQYALAAFALGDS